LPFFFLFYRALRAVLILRNRHNETSQAGSEPCLSLAYSETSKECVGFVHIY
jgi:hypothetical protein